MSKKTFTFFILILIVLMVFLGWYLFFRNTAPQNPASGGQNQSSGNLFPFGTGPTGTTSTKTPGTGGSSGSTTIDLGGIHGSGTTRLPRLRQISFSPTAGAVAFDRASSTIIRYMDRATGHMYETDSESPDVTKISNITIPKIHEAIWSSNGNELITRYLRGSELSPTTFYAKVTATTSLDLALEGLYLPSGIQGVSILGAKIFYFSLSSNGEQGILANIDGTKKSALFESSFGDWTSSWTSAKAIVLYSKPSGLALGSAYTLNPANGEYVKIIGSVNGLAAVANTDASAVLYSQATTNSIKTFALDTKSLESKTIGIRTLAEKCVWSNKQKNIVYCAVPQSLLNGLYPDDWYKGKISFSDDLWQINVSTGETVDMLTPDLEVGTPMDMMNLSLDQSEKVIVFTNKKDMTVWRYNLVE